MKKKPEKLVKNYLAYQGEKLTVEWFFNSHGKSEALEYFEKLTILQKKKLIHLLLMLGDMGKIFNKEKFRHEGNQIYAFKPMPDRFLCFFYDGSKVIITNAFEKKSQKMPAREKAKAEKARMEYKKRCKGGIYYG